MVTGGAGFIGSHLVDALLARGDEVVVIDDLSTGRRENLPAKHPRLEFIHSDLARALERWPAQAHCEEIYHLAAAVGVKLVMDDPIRAIETNVGQTGALLRFAASAQRRPRVLIASSSEVYGKSAKSPFSEDDDVVYGPTSMVRWSYACAKAIDEYLALAHASRDRLPVVVARFFNTVGPRQSGEYGMVLPRFVRAALAGRDLVVYGDGSASRCFCDVRDVVRALPALVGDPRCHGRIFNVGSDRSITIARLAEMVVSTLASTSTRRCVPYDDVYPAGFEDLRQRQPDLTRIREAIGFAPSIPLEQTIRDVAESMRKESPMREVPA